MISKRLKKGTELVSYSPTRELLNEKFIAEAIWYCLKNNDPEGVVEVIQTYNEKIKGKDE